MTLATLQLDKAPDVDPTTILARYEIGLRTTAIISPAEKRHIHSLEERMPPTSQHRDCALRFHNVMSQSADIRRGVRLVLLDNSAAFDTLDIATLLRRLHIYDSRGAAQAWFTSYMYGRTYVTGFNGETSDISSMKLFCRGRSLDSYYLLFTWRR